MYNVSNYYFSIVRMLVFVTLFTSGRIGMIFTKSHVPNLLKVSYF